MLFLLSWTTSSMGKFMSGQMAMVSFILSFTQGSKRGSSESSFVELYDALAVDSVLSFSRCSWSWHSGINNRVRIRVCACANRAGPHLVPRLTFIWIHFSRTRFPSIRFIAATNLWNSYHCVMTVFLPALLVSTFQLLSHNVSMNPIFRVKMLKTKQFALRRYRHTMSPSINPIFRVKMLKTKQFALRRVMFLQWKFPCCQICFWDRKLQKTVSLYSNSWILMKWQGKDTSGKSWDNS